jgi:hypothetical protein
VWSSSNRVRCWIFDFWFNLGFFKILPSLDIRNREYETDAKKNKWGPEVTRIKFKNGQKRKDVLLISEFMRNSYSVVSSDIVDLQGCIVRAVTKEWWHSEKKRTYWQNKLTHQYHFQISSQSLKKHKVTKKNITKQVKLASQLWRARASSEFVLWWVTVLSGFRC